VDNEVLGIVPLKDPISVDVGRHEVAVTDGAEEIFKEVIRIAGEQEMTIEVGDDSKQTNAAAEPTPAPIQESLKTPVSASKPKTNKGRIASFALLGAAAAVAVGAAVTGAMALDQEGEIWDRCDSNGNCYSEDYDGNFDDDQYRLRTLGITTDVLIGVASAAAVAGTVLLIVSRNKNKKERVKGRVTPAMAADFFGIFVSGRF
jgi:Fe2+ transport system protein FeoA